jgi:ankyrin repeat protein
LQELIRAQADVTLQNVHGLTSLHFAAYNSHMEVVQELLRAGADTAHAVAPPSHKFGFSFLLIN